MDEAKYRRAEGRLWAHFGLTPSERVISLAQLGVEVRLQEIGHGPPILFLHGGTSAGSTWVPLLEFFDDYRCLVVDRPGTGLSGPLPLDAQSLPRFADLFVRDVLTALNVERAHLVASSLGGYIALRSAAAHPGRVCRMVQMACPAFAPGMTIPGFLKVMTIAPMRLLLNTLPPGERFGQNVLRQSGHGMSLDAGRIPHVVLDWFEALQRHTHTMRNESELVAAYGSLRGFDRSLTLTRELLGSISTPTLFLWGDDDVFGDLDVATHLVSLMPRAELDTMPSAGHYPWLDDPKAIAVAAKEFLASGTP